MRKWAVLFSFLFVGCVADPSLTQTVKGLEHDLALIKKMLAHNGIDTTGLSYKNPQGVLKYRTGDDVSPWEVVDLAERGIAAFTVPADMKGLTYEWRLVLSWNNLKSVPAGIQAFVWASADFNRICKPDSTSDERWLDTHTPGWRDRQECP